MNNEDQPKPQTDYSKFMIEMCYDFVDMTICWKNKDGHPFDNGRRFVIQKFIIDPNDSIRLARMNGCTRVVLSEGSHQITKDDLDVTSSSIHEWNTAIDNQHDSVIDLIDAFLRITDAVDEPRRSTKVNGLFYTGRIFGSGKK